jgi:hypothetical protein
MMISLKQLQYAEQRMRNHWHKMVVAEERGASAVELERMYDAYLQVLAAYLRCYTAYQDEQGGVNIHRCA